MQLARIGSDHAIGFLIVGADGTFPAELAELVQQAPQTTVEELARMLADDAVAVIDLRNPGERETGYIEGSIAEPLAQLRARIRAVLPAGQPIVVHCAGGWRSSVAASLLLAQGFPQVSGLEGGYDAWVERQAALAGCRGWGPQVGGHPVFRPSIFDAVECGRCTGMGADIPNLCNSYRGELCRGELQLRSRPSRRTFHRRCTRS